MYYASSKILSQNEIIIYMDNDKLKTLGFNIKVERMRKGLTQFQLAEMINISIDSVKKIETGKQNPSALIVFDISNVLDIDINLLFKDIV